MDEERPLITDDTEDPSCLDANSRHETSPFNCATHASNEQQEATHCDVDDGDGNYIFCCSFERSCLKSFGFHVLAFCTAGFLYLICYWKPLWYLSLTHREAPLRRADKVLLKDSHKQSTVEDVRRYSLFENEMISPVSCMENDEMPREIRRRSTTPSKFPEEGTAHFRQRDPLGHISYKSRAMQSEIKYFTHKELKYFWNEATKTFKLLAGYEGNVMLKELHDFKHGITEDESTRRRDLYGANRIDVHVKSYARLFFEESADPFYVFQIFSCILWFSDEYYYYAGAIVLISIVSICISIYQTRKHLETLREMVAKSDMVTVRRPSGLEQLVSSDTLVPGDVIVIPAKGCTLHCDAVLISGTVIVNESSLTGESVPVTKVSIPSFDMNTHSATGDQMLSAHKHKRNILFCGTQVLQTRFYGDAKVLGVVYNTGFSSMKGNLIRSILYPKPVNFKFFLDALKFVSVLGIFAFIGLGYTAYIFYRDGAKPKEVVLRSLDIITIAVPPALPAAMSVGVVYALQRLKKEDIFCISPSRINIAGKVKLVCFDKTGTLTEEGLDIYGFIEEKGGHFKTFATNTSELESCNFITGMAACHSLTQIDGKLCGNPLDLKMFEASGWELEEVGSETEHFETVAPTIVRPRGYDEVLSLESLLSQRPPHEIALLKLFPFSSDVQRMSVLVRRLGAPSMDVYTKGSPEMIASLCCSETVPNDFEFELSKYTTKGYRVLALAWKPLDRHVLWHQAQHFTRDQVECDLNFLGLVVLRNTLKPETAPVIEQLYDANIRVVMITGDNLLTAVSVARECSMVAPQEKIICVSVADTPYDSQCPVKFAAISEVDSSLSPVRSGAGETFLNRNYHFAMTGKTFSIIRRKYFDLYDRILLCGTVFARMLPDQKAQLVQDLQKIGYGVAMCGDGANDCGALKIANCGISLSEAEASVASPFTSKKPNIECVLKVIKEGRCALATSFSVFKYMALYSMVQYCSVLLLYYVESNLGNFQYLYIDLILILPIAVTMSRTASYEVLVKRRPLGSLIHPLVLFSLITQVAIQASFQFGLWFYTRSIPSYKDTDWFRKTKPSKNGSRTQIMCFENTSLFCLSCFQYILLACAFAVGKPFRKPAYTNVWMMLVMFSLFAFTLALAYFNGSLLPSVFELVKIRDAEFIITLFELAAMNALLSVVLESMIVPSKWLQKLFTKCRGKRGHKNRYKHIQGIINMDEQWPPLLSTHG